MSGLETIVKTIQEEAGRRGAVGSQPGPAGRRATLAEAKALTDGECEKIVEAGRQGALDIRARAEADAAMRRRRALLARKQELLDQTVRAAREALVSQPEKAYFGFLLRLAQSSAERGEGVMYLSKRDLTRLPADFHQALNAALPEGSTLDIASEARSIDGGFILQYGDIEQNCSLSAIFDVDRERIFDVARAALFS
jgi:V/A-type H+-transporting ATPase subunit E